MGSGQVNSRLVIGSSTFAPASAASDLDCNPELDRSHVPNVWPFIASAKDNDAVELMLAQKIFGRPHVMAPETPAQAVTRLRKAFMDVFQDKEFLADGDKSRIDISPTSGEEVKKLVAQVFAAKPAIVGRAKAITQE